MVTFWKNCEDIQANRCTGEVDYVQDVGYDIYSVIFTQVYKGI